MLKLIYKFNRWFDGIPEPKRFFVFLIVFVPFVACGPYIIENIFGVGTTGHLIGMIIWGIYILFLCVGRMIGYPTSPNKKDKL